jgi:hypothetical protein
MYGVEETRRHLSFLDSTAMKGKEDNLEDKKNLKLWAAEC